ncbi:MAG: cytochrome c [Planctomycetales bacterium]|nr:cytochrome c [Planctomycetales bacterium]MCC0025192.1 cytochrome c [Hyphomicrobiaceae bacterium]
MKRSKIGWLLASALAFAGVTGVLAHGDATGIVKDRMDGMIVLREQMRNLTPVLDGNSNLSGEELVEIAELIAAKSGTEMTDLFPEGSLQPASQALERIWDDWDEFATYAESLESLGKELNSLALRPLQNPADTQSEPMAELSEWERLDASVLLGLANEAQAVDDAKDAELVLVQTENRSVEDVVADIANTCAACHQRFRRSE